MIEVVAYSATWTPPNVRVMVNGELMAPVLSFKTIEIVYSPISSCVVSVVLAVKQPHFESNVMNDGPPESTIVTASDSSSIVPGSSYKNS